MKVWFGCTTLEWEKYRKYYFQIRDELVKSGAIVLYDWIDYADEVSKGKLSNKRSSRVYDQVIKAITSSDFVVIENTVPNFSTSHQINFALMRRKPTLVLRLHKDRTLFNDSYIESIKDPNLTVKTYDEETLPAIVQKFAKLNSLDKSQGRYNIVLEKKHKYYLDWASQFKNISRSRAIRNLIEKEMVEDDDFKKYLGTIN